LFQLSGVEIDLPKAIFRFDASAGIGPGTQRFRADHDAQIPVLDGLEKRHLLRKEGQRYRVSLIALAGLYAEGAGVLTDAQKVFELSALEGDASRVANLFTLSKKPTKL
jgi:hypothetical protein